MPLMELVLGTAQWGQPYGISNTTGVPTDEEIVKILAVADENGITDLHTKKEYGLSERTIGLLTDFNLVICHSIYSEDEFSDADKISILQVPLNVFDQRMIKSGFLKRLKEKGYRVYARSIFLQGLLLMDDDRFKSYFDFVKERGLSKLEAAIQFVRQVKEIDACVIGVVSAHQLTEIIEAFKKPLLEIDFSPFVVDNLDTIDPRRWTQRWNVRRPLLP